MNYLTELTKEEIKYICKSIPFAVVTGYFRRYPKEFTTIRPGFRVKSLNEESVARILFDFRSRDFIRTFIIKCIRQWIKEIDEELEKAIKEGKSTETAYIDVLPQSFFAENVPLYFKIKEEEKSEDYLLILSAAVSYQADKIKNNRDEIGQMKKKGAEIDKKVEELNDKFLEEEKNTERLRKNALDMKAALEEKDSIIWTERKRNSELADEIESLRQKLEMAEKERAKKASEFIEKTSLIIEQSESREKEIEDLQKSLEEADCIITEYREKIASSKDGSEAIKAVNRDLEAQILVFRRRILEMEEKVADLLAEKKDLDILIQQLREENVALNAHNDELQSAVQELEVVVKNMPLSVENVCIETKKALLYTIPKCPVDMDDFDECFSYNFTNIGFDKTDEAANELVDYVKQTVFRGVPLLIKRGPGINLANCLANTIYGQSHARVFSYKSGMKLSEIEKLLADNNDRVICIDGFIGTCNEIELVPILEQHRDKIIVLTYMYDKTLRYVPVEILSSFCFISMDRFHALMKIKDITEDSSEIMEKDSPNQNKCKDNRSRKIFMEIAQECGIDFATASAMTDSIEDEASMNRILLFTLLPFVVSVIGVNPYNCSKRLQKYAGESGRCPNKETIMRWFG